MGKRGTSCGEDALSSKKTKPLKCILHVKAKNHGNVIAFRDVKVDAAEKLSSLHQIWDNGLAEPNDSPHRMENIWTLIPETLEGVDLESVGYHRYCYQQFTQNQNRLKQLNIQIPSTSKAHQSPRRTAHSTESRTLFPPECIYCEKIEMKIGGKTEKPNKFTLKSAWQSLASEAEKLGKTALARKIRGLDLCSVEAKHHTSCHRTFKTEYHNFIRAEEREQWRKVLILNGQLLLQLTVMHSVRFCRTYKTILSKRTALCNYPRWDSSLLTSSKSMDTQMISIVVYISLIDCKVIRTSAPK